MTEPLPSCGSPPGHDNGLRVLGGLCVSVGGQRIDLPEGGKRLLALLALRTGRIERHRVAVDLWPAVDRHRADGNLRTTLWRLQGAGVDLVDSTGDGLAIVDGLTVDVRLLLDWIQRIVAGRPRPGDLELGRWMEDGLCVLPGWHDDWLVIERERLRQGLLQALEALSRRLYQAGRFAAAVDAALIAVSADPLRETAQQTLVEAHLAEGNLVEAHRSVERYRRVLHEELGVPLSPLMSSLISGFRRPRGPHLSVVR